MNKKNIVVIGGGNGAAISINALKPFIEHINLSAIITMSDSGGSSGFFRKEFGVLPTGDIMRAVLAMSCYDHNILKKIFYRNRFEHAGKLDGHNVGNLFLVLAQQYGADFLQALKALHQAVEAMGRVYPVTLDTTDFVVELTDGTTVVGEHEIDRPTYDTSLRIKRAWLEPAPSFFEGAHKALEEADVIILGPGSLYCSIVATLVVPGVMEAIKKNKNAKLVYVMGNAYEQDGETGPRCLCDFIAELEEYLPRKLDTIFYNNHVFTTEELEHYEKKGWSVIGYNPTKNTHNNVVAGDFEKDIGGLDSDKLGKILKDIVTNC
ncbi:MAG: YvcK family protein [Candidatus Magasanikbacteria bacterium]|nr:YvcK family protein [Candidatus Magasanikbacteria bacterium]